MSSARSPLDDAAAALGRAREVVPEAADLMNALAQLAARPIPVDAIRTASDEAPGEYGEAMGPGSVEPTLSALEEAGLMRREEDGIVLLQAASRALREDLVRPVAASAADAACRFLEAWREQLEAGTGDEDRAWGDVADHALALAERMPEAGRAPDPALRVGTRAAGRLQDRSRPAEAQRLLAELQEAARRAPRLEEPFVLAALADQRAGLLADLERPGEAAKQSRRAVREAEERCDEEDPRRAVILHNAGGVLKRLGRPEEATELYDRAYVLLEEHHASGTPLELQLCLDLSDVLLAREEFGRAAEVAGRAVALARERLGRYHPETAAAVSNLGRAFRGEGRLERARTSFRQAIEILEEVYSEDHPALAPDLSNLGATLEEKGRVGRARELHQRAKDIFRGAYGADHRLTRAARAYLDDL